MRAFKHRISLLALGLISSVSNSQIVDPGALGGALRQNIEQQIPSPNALPLPESDKDREPKRDEKPGELKVLIKGFKFEGVTLIPVDDLQSALKQWVGQRWTFNELQQVNEIVGEVYKKQGYLVQSVLPPQKIGEDGVLTIKVIEAKLGSINIDAAKESRMSAETAQKFLAYNNESGEYLRTDNIERAIYILKEVPGVAISTELEPGQKDGEANLKVRLESSPLVTGRLEANNYGSRSTGQYQGGAFIAINNPGGWGDQINLNALLAEGSQYAQAGYSLPIGYSGLRFGANLSALNYRTIGIFSGSNGRSQSVGANLTYPLLRSIEANLNIGLNYDLKSYQNFNSQTNSVNSNYSLSDWSLSLSGNRYDDLLGGGITSGQVSLVLGELRLNSDNPSTYGEYTPSSFRKFNMTFSRNQQVIPNDLILNISGALQFANVNLDSAEKIYLGGPYGVRAFPVAQAGGAQGGTLSVELQKQLPERVVASLFFDAGRVQQYVNPIPGMTGPNLYNLYAAGIGAKWNWDRLTLNGSVAFRLDDNPVRTLTGTNVDGRYSPAYFWLQLQYAL